MSGISKYGCMCISWNGLEFHFCDNSRRSWTSNVSQLRLLLQIRPWVVSVIWRLLDFLLLSAGDDVVRTAQNRSELSSSQL